MAGVFEKTVRSEYLVIESKKIISDYFSHRHREYELVGFTDHFATVENQKRTREKERISNRKMRFILEVIGSKRTQKHS